MPKILRCLLATLVLLLAGILAAQTSRADKSQMLPGKAPILLYRVEPVYPIAAKVQRTEGTVVLRVSINEKGEVRRTEVLQGHPAFNDAAVAAVKQWRYAPTLVDGKAVAVTTVARVQFSPTEKSRYGVEPPRREPIRTGEKIPEGKRLYGVQPVYPPEAKQERISGTVQLQITLNEKGEVYEARILRGHPLLDRAALDAVYQWRYAPTILNGEPVAVIGTVDVVFKIGAGSTIR